MKVVVLFAGSLFAAASFSSAHSQSQNAFPQQAAAGEATVLLSGRVITEENSRPPQSVTVFLDCMGRPSSEVNTDPEGNFSFRVRGDDLPESDSSRPQDLQRNDSSLLSSCDLSAKLPGYAAEPLHLTALARGVGMSSVGTIILHPSVHGTFAVNVNSLAAPEKAKAAFEKGEEQKKKGKWAAAMDSFRKAIAVYPRYALAWLELGRVQATQHDFIDAQHSFRKSVTEDSRLVDGYVELAHLAAQQNEWHELLSASDHLVQTHPETPEFWFWNSAANFNLGNMTEAEASITRGLRVDSAHRVPQMEYLYALVLARRQEFRSAAEHTAAYLKLSPQGVDAAQAQRRLAEFQRLAAVAAAR